MTRPTLSFTCSAANCRRHITLAYLQHSEDAYWQATEKGWSFRWQSRTLQASAGWQAYCPSHPFYRFWTVNEPDREAQRLNAHVAMRGSAA